MVFFWRWSWANRRLSQNLPKSVRIFPLHARKELWHLTNYVLHWRRTTEAQLILKKGQCALRYSAWVPTGIWTNLLGCSRTALQLTLRDQPLHGRLAHLPTSCSWPRLLKLLCILHFSSYYSLKKKMFKTACSSSLLAIFLNYRYTDCWCCEWTRL